MRASARAAHEVYLRQTAERKLDEHDAVERSIRLIEAGADHPNKLTDEQRRRIVQAAAGLRRWAAEQAAKLPPLTDQQVAAAGRLAAELDAKRARQDAGDDA